MDCNQTFRKLSERGWIGTQRWNLSNIDEASSALPTSHCQQSNTDKEAWLVLKSKAKQSSDMYFFQYVVLRWSSSIETKSDSKL